MTMPRRKTIPGKYRSYCGFLFPDRVLLFPIPYSLFPIPYFLFPIH